VDGVGQDCSSSEFGISTCFGKSTFDDFLWVEIVGDSDGVLFRCDGTQGTMEELVETTDEEEDANVEGHEFTLQGLVMLWLLLMLLLLLELLVL